MYRYMGSERLIKSVIIIRKYAIANDLCKSFEQIDAIAQTGNDNT